MAGTEPAAAKNLVKIYPADAGISVLGGMLRSDPGVPVLCSIWKPFSARVFGLFRRGVIVEKNLLWYNQCMGKKRRSTEFKNNSQVIDMEQARKQRLEKRRAEKAKEEAKVKAAARQNTRGKMAIRRNRTRRRIMIGLIVVLVLGLFSFSIFNIFSLKKEQHEAEAQKKELMEEKKQLEKELQEVNDLSNVEEQARNQLKLIKPGETIFLFPDSITDSDDSTVNSDSDDSSDQQ